MSDSITKPENSGNSDSIVEISKPKEEAAPPKAKAKSGYAEMADNTKKIEGLAGELRESRKSGDALDVPKAPKLELAPEYKGTSPMEAFGSIATAFGLLASLATRQPLTSGLNAAGDAMRSMKEGNIQDYNIKMDEWRAHTDMALKQFDSENKQFSNIIAKKNLSQSELIGELNAWAAANNNVAAQMHLRQGDAHIALEGARIAESSRARVEAHADAVANRRQEFNFHVEEANNKLIETYIQHGLSPEGIKVATDALGKNAHLPPAEMARTLLPYMSGNQKEADTYYKDGMMSIDPAQRGAYDERVKAMETDFKAKGQMPTGRDYIAATAGLGSKASATQLAKTEDRQRAVGAALTDLQTLNSILADAHKKGSWVTGAGGKVARIGSAVGGFTGQNLGGQDAARVESLISSIQSRTRDLINVAGSRITADTRAKADKILQGLGSFATIDEAQQSIDDLSHTMMESNGPPLNAPADAKLRYLKAEHRNVWYTVNDSGKLKLWEYE